MHWKMYEYRGIYVTLVRINKTIEYIGIYMCSQEYMRLYRTIRKYVRIYEIIQEYIYKYI